MSNLMEELLAESKFDNLKQGAIVPGIITEIRQNEVVVDIGGKSSFASAADTSSTHVASFKVMVPRPSRDTRNPLVPTGRTSMVRDPSVLAMRLGLNLGYLVGSLAGQCPTSLHPHLKITANGYHIPLVTRFQSGQEDRIVAIVGVRRYTAVRHAPSPGLIQQLQGVGQQRREPAHPLLRQPGVAGGPRFDDRMAGELGVDRIFGRGTTPAEVASFLVYALSQRRSS
jgi:hypothetical protein